MANKFWLIWCQTRGTPTKQHATIEAALAEARRLAAVHPGSQFYVLESKVLYEGEVVINSRTCSEAVSTDGSANG